MPDWDEEMAKQYLAKGVKISGLTAKALTAGALLLLKKLASREKYGQRTLTQIKRTGGKLISNELMGADLAAMDEIAKRYKVAFAAMENPDGKSYTLFFKAESDQQMAAALKAYLAQTMQKGEKPQEKKEPLDDRLERVKTRATEHSADRAQEKTREKTLDRAEEGMGR